MSAFYNPFVRTFCRLRAVLVRHHGAARGDVRPDTLVSDLIPAGQHEILCARLREAGVRVPDFPPDCPGAAWGLLAALKAAVSLALANRSWFALLSAIPLGLVAYRVSRLRAVRLPGAIRTVGDLVAFLTSYHEHRSSGYRWTRNDVALKVRLLVAVQLGYTLDQVQEHSTFLDLA